MVLFVYIISQDAEKSILNYPQYYESTKTTHLRHTFATIALQYGVDIKNVSGMLGHFCAGFTLDTYAHVTTTVQKEVAQPMGKIS